MQWACTTVKNTWRGLVGWLGQMGLHWDGFCYPGRIAGVAAEGPLDLQDNVTLTTGEDEVK